MTTIVHFSESYGLTRLLQIIRKKQIKIQLCNWLLFYSASVNLIFAGFFILSPHLGIRDTSQDDVTYIYDGVKVPIRLNRFRQVSVIDKCGLDGNAARAFDP